MSVAATTNGIIALAERGWHLIPVRHREKRPWFTEWQHKASADVPQVERWIEEHPRCNWGVLLGPKSNLIDLEDDTPEGRKIFEDAMELCGVKTPCYSSGKSIHRLFQYDERIAGQTANVIQISGTEWRFGTESTGAQSVIPPSIHPSGKRYEWLPGLSPDDVPVARLPDELWELLQELRRQDDEREAAKREQKRKQRRQSPPVVPASVQLDGVYTNHVAAAEAAIANLPWNTWLGQESWTPYQDAANGDQDWTRPGNDWSNQKSATITFRDDSDGMLHVWSNAAPIPVDHYSRWRFWYRSNGFLDGNAEQVEAAKAFLGPDKTKEVDDAFKRLPPEPPEQDDEPWELKDAWKAAANPVPKREVIIDGLVRRGDVINIVASTKVGKSWLALLLLFCVASGRRWLGRQTTPGRCLLIDNELHDSDIQNRLATVVSALGVPGEDSAPFDYIDLRGASIGIEDIERKLSRFQPGELTLVVLDAKYRFFGSGKQENSNDDQTEFHNAIDRLARKLNCVIVLVHHSTKGNQSAKTATDVGSGGGSQSRAVDCHLVIRPHEESDELAVLDAAVRTFAPVQSQTLLWEFPLWKVAENIQPVLKQEMTRGDSRQAAKDQEAVGILVELLSAGPSDGMTRYELQQESGFGKDRINRLLRIGQDEKRIKKSGTREAKNGKVSDLFQIGFLEAMSMELDRTDLTD